MGDEAEYRAAGEKSVAQYDQTKEVVVSIMHKYTSYFYDLIIFFNVFLG